MNLMLFVFTYFWELSAEVMTTAFIATSVGVFLGSAFLARPVSARFERRTLACFGVLSYPSHCGSSDGSPKTGQ